jgi:hypothetical protein
MKLERNFLANSHRFHIQEKSEVFGVKYNDKVITAKLK